MKCGGITSEEVTSEDRPEGWKGASLAKIPGRMHLPGITTSSKALGWNPWGI